MTALTRSSYKLGRRVAATLLLATGALISAPMLCAQGFGGYDFASTSDRAIPFDYDSSGYLDHFVFYRPGSGIVYIEGKDNGAYTPVFTSSDGIGGYDLKSAADRLLAFDYTGNGHADHLVCYRPGTGIVFILANDHGNFYPVFTSANGIGGYDLMSSSDQIIAFDYNGAGYYDHLVLYRPGSGLFSVLQNNNGTFSEQVTSTAGVGGYDLSSPNDRLVAYDYYGIGTADHLLAYRPGTGIAFVLENTNGTGNFNAVMTSSTGIGGYDLKSTADRIIAYDYEDTGNLNYLLAYRPGTGTAWIVGSAYFSFSPSFQSSTGIGGYDLLSTADRVFAFDYTDTGKQADLGLYRPGSGIFWVEGNMNGVFPLLAHKAD